jgi:hypothetical protein
MKTRIDARFRLEAGQFALRFACDDCGHFDAPRELCSLGFDAAPRRDVLRVPPPLPREGGDTFESCKTFELA